LFQAPLKLLAAVGPEVALDSDQRRLQPQQLIRETLDPLNPSRVKLAGRTPKQKTN
jgi:hypothetical protein